MRLLRVQVPEFRALKDVDITFEKDFSPAVFPIGSQNGGGKSTLLQLIFTLLHCPFHADREQFLQNILQGVSANDKPKLLIRLNILDIDTEITLDFFVEKNNKKNILADQNSTSELELSSIRKIEELMNLTNQVHRLNNARDLAFKVKDSAKNENDFNPDLFYGFLDEIIDIESILTLEQRSYFYQIKNDINTISRSSLFSAINEVPNIISSIKQRISKILDEASVLSKNLNTVYEYLDKEEFNFVCTFDSSGQAGALLCRKSDKEKDIEALLEKISERVFLASPSTQIFIFTPKESQKLLFKRADRQEDYYSFVKKTESYLPGLFTYDFVSVDLLIDAFKTARDKDFKKAIQSGVYGNSYQDLINDLI
jgi:hypothetical protein